MITEIKTKQKKLITIIIPTFNRRDKLRDCIESILRQTYRNCEIIISDDCSSDNTRDVVKGYKDPRIILIENEINGGASMARNVAIKKAKGDIIFFTDDDVRTNIDWIEKGLNYFDDPQVIGIEGKIIFVNETYREAYGDRVVRNLTGGLYMTANAAYRRRELLKNGLFDPTISYIEDRELALRMLKYGKIIYAPDAVVNHQLERYSVKSFMGEVKKIRFWFLLMRKTGERKYVVHHIYDPYKFITLFFPPAIFVRLFTHRYRSIKDWIMWLLIYPRLWYERILIWRYAIVYKMFIL
jgi:glycosyltransferase involved in cell wall biosynthesis